MMPKTHRQRTTDRTTQSPPDRDPGVYTLGPLSRLKPVRMNDTIYRPIDPDDPATVRVVESIRRTKTVDRSSSARTG
jgi:hypothetical protein